MIVAALYVEKGGVYYDLEDVDPWGVDRDARLYAGPHPVVAHPPCERWGRYWNGGPSYRGPVPLRLGDDGGCFEAALFAVRRWGGVLEHPEGSHAWRAHHLALPPRDGGWVSADFQGGWTCCVEQGHYGHRARKATWLYARGLRDLPSLIWGAASVAGDDRLDDLAEGRGRRRSRTGIIQRMSKKERAATPVPFRDALLAMVRDGRQRVAA